MKLLPQFTQSTIDYWEWQRTIFLWNKNRNICLTHPPTKLEINIHGNNDIEYKGVRDLEAICPQCRKPFKTHYEKSGNK